MTAREHQEPMRKLARRVSPAARLELERLQGMPRWQVTPTPRKEKP